MVKAIIFDFFGVIRQDSFQGWMDNHGFTREDEAGQVSRLLDIGNIKQTEFYERLAKLSNQTVPELENEMRGYKKFDDGVIDFIKSLRNTYKIVLLSNSEGKYLRNVLSENNLEALFDEIFISGELRAAKPDREMFELVLQNIQLGKDEVVFVDDQQKNTSAAEAIGIKSILFTSVEQLKIEINKAND